MRFCCRRAVLCDFVGHSPWSSVRDFTFTLHPLECRPLSLMARHLTILGLLLTQLIAPTVAWGQAVLCVHADGSAFVESPDEWMECHTAAAKSSGAGVSEPSCQDFAIPSSVQIEKTVRPRTSSVLILQLCLTPIAPWSDLAHPPMSRRCLEAFANSIMPSDGVLASLSTVILTV
jgi:hypothetical protein